MSKDTINALRAAKSRIRDALSTIAVHAESFADDAEAMANNTGDTFDGAGVAMKAIVDEVLEVRDIFDLGGNGGPALNSPTVAPVSGSGAPATTPAGSVERVKNYPDGASVKIDATGQVKA